MANAILATAEAWSRSRMPILLLQATTVIGGLAMARFLYQGYSWRRRFQALQAQGVPMMEHSPFWGHLRSFGTYLTTYPSDVSVHEMSIWLVENWKTLFPRQERCPPVAYIDMWPVMNPLIFVLHPKASAQFTQTKNLPKDVTEHNYIRPLTGNLDILSADGALWKQWRSRFNPGFSSRSITAMVPVIMEDMLVFLDVIGSLAGKDGEPGEVVQLERLTTNLTFDIIGKAMMGLRLNEQSGAGSALKVALTDQARRIGVRFSLTRSLAEYIPWSRLRRNNRAMRRSLIPHIKQQFSASGPAKESSTVMDFAIGSMRKEPGGVDQAPDQHTLDVVLANLKAFLFAGHDTTATTICWAFKCLEENPACMARLRHEHDECLGRDPDEAPRRILESPHIINAMPYTLGCIKETLRLYTPAATMRAGQPDFSFTDPVSQAQYPTEGFAIADGVPGIHHHPDVWPRPTEFLPERWLAREGDPLFPVKDAWRPFEQGPRNCIGQELAMLELKLVLALTVRKFDIEQAWERWDVICGRTGKKDMIGGHRLYMIGDSTGHTKDETPVHIKRRKHTIHS